MFGRSQGDPGYDARADLKLAKKLESMSILAGGMAAGVVNTAQARVIVRAVDSLPRRGGNVRVFSDTSSHAARYVRITSATDVSQTPTLVVVNRQGKARVGRRQTAGRKIGGRECLPS